MCREGAQCSRGRGDGHARGREAKGQVQQVVLLLPGRLQRVVLRLRQDDVAGGAGQRAGAGALQLHAVLVRQAHEVVALQARRGQLGAALVHKDHAHGARARQRSRVAVPATLQRAGAAGSSAAKGGEEGGNFDRVPNKYEKK